MENEDVIEVGRPPNVYKTIKWRIPALPSGLSWEDAEIDSAAVWGNGLNGTNHWVTGSNLAIGKITPQTDGTGTALVNLYLMQRSLPDTEYGVLMRYTVTNSSGASNYFVTSGMGAAT
jgi:hypothetical protein